MNNIEKEKEHGYKLNYKNLFLFLLFSVILIVSSLIIKLQLNGNNVKDTASPIENISDKSWDKIAKKKYFFGHQSVGNNILEGIESIVHKNPQIKLNVMRGTESNQLDDGVILHQLLGEWDNPYSKLNAFDAVMREGVGQNVDYAFLKFCYVDVVDRKSVDDIFNEYTSKIDRLKKEYPKVTFIHFTIPLHSIDKSLIKGSMRRLLQKGEFGVNVNRIKYNSVLKEYYGGKDPIFDVAYYESISFATGKVSQATDLFGNNYLSLSDDNTDDGGHLNENGKRWIAENFLNFLASLDD